MKSVKKQRFIKDVSEMKGRYQHPEIDLNLSNFKEFLEQNLVNINNLIFYKRN